MKKHLMELALWAGLVAMIRGAWMIHPGFGIMMSGILTVATIIGIIYVNRDDL